MSHYFFPCIGIHHYINAKTRGEEMPLASVRQLSLMFLFILSNKNRVVSYILSHFFFQSPFIRSLFVTVRSKCNIFFYYSFLPNSFFLCARKLVYTSFRPFVQSSFLALIQVFVSFCQFSCPRQRFPCCFIFISAFLQFYFPHFLAYLNIVVCQYSL